ncbi:DeoR/GlpR family transcriptional regulator of sugar metabolism [Pedobacter sp. UYEF25]
MSRMQHRARIQRLLKLIRQQRVGTVSTTSILFGCHPSTIERMIKRLRLEGHLIVYDRSLKRYQLTESMPLDSLDLH